MKRVLLALLAACGGGGHHTTDAPPLDATGDSFGISSDAPANGVTLHVTSGGDPVPGVAAIFLDAADKPLATVMTDANGDAASAMTPGGTVTAIVHQGMDLDHLVTFTAVAPGDALVLELSPSGPAPATNVNLTFPTNGAQLYTMYPSCGDPIASSDAQFVFRPLGCAGTADFVVSAGDSETTSSFLVAMGIDVARDTAVTGTFAPPATPAYAYANIPGAITGVSTRAAVLGHNGVMYGAASTETLAANQTAVTLHETLPSTTMRALVTTNLWPQSSELGQQLVADIVPDASADYAIDVTQTMLPRFTTAPAYDPASRSVVWAEAAADTQATVVRVQLHAYRDDIPAGRSWSWEIAAAKNATTVTFPALPAVDGFSFIPVATDTVGIDDLTTAAFPGGFAALHASPFRDLVPALTSGHAVIESLAPPQL